MSERTDESADRYIDHDVAGTFALESETPEAAGKSRGLVANFLELILLVVIAFSLAWVIKTFVVQPFFIPSASMEPTLVPRDHVLVNKFIYRFENPHSGDIVVFRYPVDPTKDYIKRVIGLPGDHIKVKDGIVYRNAKRVTESYIAMPRDASDYPSDGGDVLVPNDKFFVMGDNRANSADSRVWGFLPRENIVGKAFVIYFPIQRVGLVN